MKKKHYYYLCSTDALIDDTEYALTNATEEYVKIIGLKFFNRIPYLEESYREDYKDKEVIKYKKLSQLVEDFIFTFNDGQYDHPLDKDIDRVLALDELLGVHDLEDDDELEEDEQSIITLRASELIDQDYLILRLDKRTGKFSFVDSDEIRESVGLVLSRHMSDHLTELFINEMNDYEEPTEEMENPLNDNKVINGLLDKVESLTGKDTGFMVVHFGEHRTYSFVIFKEKHPNRIDNDELTQRPNGYFYECGFESLMSFMNFNLMFGRHAGITLKVMRMNDDMEYTGMHEVYGFSLGTIDEKLVFEQLDAEEVYSAFTTDYETQKPLIPDKNVIYKGKYPEDVICGFDKI